MADKAHEDTDKILEEMEKKVAKEYRQASEEVREKLRAYLKHFKKRDNEMRQMLDNGEITEEKYKIWRVNQFATGKRWKDMRDTLADEMVNANNIARNIVNDSMADVYSLNRNYATYECEKDARIDTSYTLYNRKATEMLFQNDSSLLPAPKEGTKAWEAMMNKDLRWNQQKINSSLLQGIMQGEPISDIANRLVDVVKMNKVSAIRNARTMTTAVENRGRNDAYDELKEKGVQLETVWMATLDDRTRHSHRLMHGQIKNEKTGRFSNGLRYPADPSGDPSEVYNCRCAEFSYVKGHPIDIPKWSEKWDKDMTFEKWLGVHEEGAPDVGALMPDTDGVMKDVPKLGDLSLPSILKDCNPGYDADHYDYATHNNCAYTSVASELRQRGYDVSANHIVKGEKVRCWYGYPGKSGKVGQGRGGFTDCFKDMMYENVGATRSSNAIERTTEKIKSFGDDSRAIIWVQWKNTTSGHYFNAKNTPDGVIFFDGQNGSENCVDYLLQAKPKLITVFRTDNLELTNYVHKVVNYDKGN